MASASLSSILSFSNRSWRCSGSRASRSRLVTSSSSRLTASKSRCSGKGTTFTTIKQSYRVKTVRGDTVFLVRNYVQRCNKHRGYAYPTYWVTLSSLDPFINSLIVRSKLLARMSKCVHARLLRALLERVEKPLRQTRMFGHIDEGPFAFLPQCLKPLSEPHIQCGFTF